METKSPASKLQADERIVMAVARAMCGHHAACRYHVALARIAIDAERRAWAELDELPLTTISDDECFVVIPHEGIVR